MLKTLTIALAGAAMVGCAGSGTGYTQVHSIEYPQITGVAAMNDGRILVNSPRWRPGHVISVFYPGGDRRHTPFPNALWNVWRPDAGLDAGRRWVCVQAVHNDALGRLWVLDPGAPGLGEVVEGGAKLAVFASDAGLGAKPEMVYRFAEPVIEPRSYLNDVRIDVEANRAYITDSGAGALVVLDLESGQAWRLLAEHASTKGEPGVVPIVGGEPWRTVDGDAPVVHADGIAFDAANGFLYWQALTARTLYRVPASVLRGEQIRDADVIAAIEDLGETVVTDGMACDSAGNVYFSALERDAVVYRTPEGALQTLAQGPELSWPDSFAWSADGQTLFVTSARIHECPPFSRTMPTEPFGVFALTPAAPR